MSFDCTKIAINSSSENQMQVFQNEEFGSIRTIEINGAPWFVGQDVARALGYGEGKSLANAVANHVDAEDKGVAEMMTPGGKQNMTIINESGLYSLVLSSKLPTAKKFKRWVTSEVLPSIRKTGGYMMPQDYPSALRALADAEEQKLKLLAENQRQAQVNADPVDAEGPSHDPRDPDRPRHHRHYGSRPRLLMTPRGGEFAAPLCTIQNYTFGRYIYHDSP